MRHSLRIGNILEEIERLIRTDKLLVRERILRNILGIPEDFHENLIQRIEMFFDMLDAILNPISSDNDIKSILKTIFVGIEELRGILNKTNLAEIREKLKKLISTINYKLCAIQSVKDLELILGEIEKCNSDITRFVISKASDLWLQNKNELKNLAEISEKLDTLSMSFKKLKEQLSTSTQSVRLIQLLCAYRHISFLGRKEVKRLLRNIEATLKSNYRPHKMLELLAEITRRVGPYTISPLFEPPVASHES